MASTLPRAPKTLGRLRHVFASAVASVQGLPNFLELKPSKVTVVLLIDGFGSANLSLASGHARFMNSLPQIDKKIATVFPSTTAAALVSLSTGLMPADHGFLGYQLFDRLTGQSQNMLSGWTEAGASTKWLGSAVSLGRSISHGAEKVFVGHSAYQASGFTEAMLPDARFVAADELSQRFDEVMKILRSSFRGVVYLYVPEVDQVGHAFGPYSARWFEQVEAVDREVGRLTSSLGSGQQVVVTADHGMIAVSQKEQIHWDELSVERPIFVGGDTRCNFVYLDNSTEVTVYQQSLRQLLPDTVLVATPAELELQGWQVASLEFTERIPDLYLICSGGGALYHRDFASSKSLRMMGHHGGISPEELNVPLLIAKG